MRVHGEKVSPFLLGNNSQLECAYKTVPFQAAPPFKLRLNFCLLARKVFKNSGVCPFQAGAVCLKTSATDLHTTEVCDLLLKHPSPCNETMTNLQISIFQGSLFCFVYHSEISQIMALHANIPNHSASWHALGIFKKLTMSRGAVTWFETVWSYGVKAIDYWTIFSMKTK